jgi:hypothetical protein
LFSNEINEACSMEGKHFEMHIGFHSDNWKEGDHLKVNEILLRKTGFGMIKSTVIEKLIGAQLSYVTQSFIILYR